jgi:hypothetical protein
MDYALLPNGSVVLLNGGSKRVMIVGRLQKQDGTDKVWDYSAVLYPEGMIDPSQMFLFDNQNIDRVYFLGFQDADELEYSSYLVDQAEDIKNGTENTEQPTE